MHASKTPSSQVYCNSSHDHNSGTLHRGSVLPGIIRGIYCDEGVRHGDGSEWEGIYGDHYSGGFADGEMRGVGKFNFSDGEEYLGMWLAPGTPQQMPRRMSAMKRHALKDGGGVGGGLADSLGAQQRRMREEADKRQQQMNAGGGGDDQTLAPPKVPLADMPDAVHALKDALVQGGLEGMHSGSGRARGSLAAGPVGGKAKKATGVHALKAQHQGAKAANAGAAGARMLSNARYTAGNPFAEAGTGVMMGNQAVGRTGLVEHGPPSKVPQADRAAPSRPEASSRGLHAQLDSRFGNTPQPPRTPRAPASPRAPPRSVRIS